MADTPSSPHRGGYALVLGGVLAVSFKAILVKWAFARGIDPGTLLALRVWVALPALIATLLVVKGRQAFRLDARTLGWIAASGCLGLAGAMLFNFYGIERIGAALATLVTFTYPAWTVGLVAAVGRERIPGRTIASLLVAFVGLALVVNPTSGAIDPVGIALCLASALCFAFYNTLTERLVARVSPIQVITVAMAFVSITVAPFAKLEAIPSDPGLWAIVLTLGIVVGYAPLIAFTYAIRAIGAGRTAIVSSLSPALTAVWAAWFLDERLSAVQLVGMMGIVGGVLLLRVLPRPHEEALDEVEATSATR